MPFLELRALVLAAATWGSQWRGMKITFRSDCSPAVTAITKGSSRTPEQMHQLRAFASLAITHGFDYKCTHIPGVANTIADVLSRSGDCDQFRASCPNALPHQSSIVLPPLPPLRSNPGDDEPED